MGTFYTRSGDTGYSGILGEGRVAKFDRRMETLGTLDEANAALGMGRALCKASGTADLILRLQRDLYAIMAEASATAETAERFHSIDGKHVTWLEQQIDILAKEVKLPNGFIVPGDILAAAALDLARAVVRRSERRVAEMLHRGELKNIEILKYMNRLSSLIYVLELKEIQETGNTDFTRAKTEQDDRNFD